jgi:hypothetical protein
METGLTVVIVLVVLAVVTLLAAQARRRRQERDRIEAAELRKAAAHGVDLDRAARIDDLLGADGSGGGWHGPSASGGFPAVDPAKREPVVPSQRTGDHDRHQREPGEDEHSGHVGGRADRHLRRHG